MTESERDPGSSQVIRRGDNSSVPLDLPQDDASTDKRKRKDLRVEGKRRLAEMGFQKQVTGSQQATNLLYEAYGLASWLGPEHYHLVKQWAQLGALVPRLVERLYEGGLFKQDGDPLKANETLLRYMAELRAHAKEAGLTPTSQAALGVDLGRMRQLDAAAEVQRLRRER